MTPEHLVADLGAITPHQRISFDDIEPLNGQTGGLTNEILVFARRFGAVTGSPLSLVHVDVIWRGPRLAEAARSMEEPGV